jgi:hypothetical protein
MLQNYYWPKIAAVTQHHCQACLYCLKRKAYNQVAIPPVQAYDLPESPMQQCHWDLTGPFPISTSGNRYLLVFKDRLTKWSEIVPLPNKEVTTVVDALIGICSRLGSPTVLISDRGTEFTAHAMSEITRILGIRHIKTSPSNPRSNGLAENHMRTLKDMLAAYVNQTHTDWDKYASLVAHFYNTTVNDATGFTPYFLLYGREDNSPDHCTTTFNRLTGPPGTRRKYSAIANDLVNHLHIIWSVPRVPQACHQCQVQQAHCPPPHIYKVGDYFFRKIIPRRYHKSKEAQPKHLLSLKLQ